jgi:heat shock protein HtpX
MPPPPVSPYGEVSRQAAHNRHKAIVAVLAAPLLPALVVAVVLGALIGWWLAPVVLVGLILAGAAWLWRAAATRALSVLAAAPLNRTSREAARLHNLVDGLCVVAGLPRPRVLVVDDEGLNALVVGTTAETTALVVTSGLVVGLSRIEMEGVVAHQLSHIRRGDALVAAVAAVTVGPLAAVWANLGARAAAALLDGREEATDAAAVGLTKFPPALASALDKMGEARVAPRHPAIDPLWDVAPQLSGFGRDQLVAALSANRVEERIAALREL